MSSESTTTFRSVTIFQTAFLGDVLLTYPLIAAVKQVLRPETVSFVSLPQMNGFLSRNENIDHIISYDKKDRDKGFGGILRIANKIRQGNCDAIIIPHRSVRSATVGRLCGAKRIIGFDKSAGSFLFTDTVKYRPELHEIQRNLSLLESFVHQVTEPDFSLKIPDDIAFSVQSLLQMNKLDKTPIIGFVPGSVWYTKRWPKEKFKSLACLLLKELTCKIVVIGGKEDWDLGEFISEADKENIVNFAGNLSVLESATVLRHCGAVVANDCGGMHIAAMAGTPVTAIFGSTIPQFGFYPWGEGHTVVQKELYCRPCGIHGRRECPEQHFRCMNEITEEEVFTAVRKSIAGTGEN